ncbi:MAG: hypothetical protein QM734_02535 [Cyclobacteriaceae bacterium]
MPTQGVITATVGVFGRRKRYSDSSWICQMTLQMQPEQGGYIVQTIRMFLASQILEMSTSTYSMNYLIAILSIGLQYLKDTEPDLFSFSLLEGFQENSCSTIQERSASIPYQDILIVPYLLGHWNSQARQLLAGRLPQTQE